jgi:hypothetical protein
VWLLTSHLNTPSELPFSQWGYNATSSNIIDRDFFAYKYLILKFSPNL